MFLSVVLVNQVRGLQAASQARFASGAVQYLDRVAAIFKNIAVSCLTGSVLISSCLLTPQTHRYAVPWLWSVSCIVLCIICYHLLVN